MDIPERSEVMERVHPEQEPWKCERCGYATVYKQSILRHLKRKIPCPPKESNASLESMLSSLLSSEGDARYTCEYCNKSFASRPGKSKHKKICPNKPSCSIPITSSVEQTSHLLSMLTSMQQELHALRSEIKEKDSQPVTITNHITNNNHQKLHVHINAFGKEDTSHLTQQFLDHCVKKTNMGLVDLLEQLHFGLADGRNANVRIRNRKEPYVEVNDGKSWKFAKKDKVIFDMVDRGQDLLQEHLEENEDRIREYLSDSMWEHIEKYFEKMEVKDNTFIHGILEDVNIMLLNKSRNRIT